MSKLYLCSTLLFSFGAWRDVNGDPLDIAEVVRCKDCESWRKYPYRNSKKGECRKNRISKYPDGYCDEAVKRETD